MMRRPVVWVLAAAACAAGAAGTARADDKADFQSLFGEAMRKARATSSTEDDVALARQMFEAVETLKDSPGVRRLVLEGALEFGMAGPEGYATAEKAVTALMELAPDRKEQWQAKRMTILEKRYAASKGPQKGADGQAYMEALLAQADGEMQAGQITQAVGHYKEAMAVARRVQPQAEEEIARKLKGIEARAKIEEQRKKLKDALDKKPRDAKTRGLLVQLLVLDLDAPGQAVGLLTDDLDDATRTYVPLAAKECGELAEQTAMELGAWYYGQLAGSSDARAAVILTRAKACYERYLKLHTTSDTAALAAKMKLQQIVAEAGKRHLALGEEVRKIRVSDPKIAPLVAGAINELWKRQGSDGTWEYSYSGSYSSSSSDTNNALGTTALVVFALLEAGAPANDPRMLNALKYLAATDSSSTYALAYRCGAFTALEPASRGPYMARLRSDANKLAAAAGPYGAFTHQSPPGTSYSSSYNWDNGNGQLGALGLWRARRAGIVAPAKLWTTIMKHWQDCQGRDGAWGYRSSGSYYRGSSDTSSETHTMTAGGVASLYQAVDAITKTPDERRQLAERTIPLQKGLQWLDKNFPMSSSYSSTPDYLYAVGRAGVLSGRKTFNSKDWADWGIAELERRCELPSSDSSGSSSGATGKSQKRCPQCGYTTRIAGRTTCPRDGSSLTTTAAPAAGAGAGTAPAARWSGANHEIALGLLFLLDAQRAKDR